MVQNGVRAVSGGDGVGKGAEDAAAEGVIERIAERARAGAEGQPAEAPRMSPQRMRPRVISGANGIAVVVPAAAIRSRPVRWLWEGRVPLGKVTLLAGDPGLGKSYITLDLAAKVSTGRLGASEDSEVGTGDVFLLTAEDDPADTIRPRLERMEADLARVHIVKGLTFETDLRPKMHLARLDRDLRALAEAMEKVKEQGGRPRLLVVDPISAFLGDKDSHNNAEVRQVLAELSRFAEHLGIAVVCVTHLSKGGAGQRAVYRAMGSLAFTAAARVVLLVAKHPDDPERRVVAAVKCNIGKEAPALSYRINDDTLVWDEGTVALTADELEALGAQQGGGEERADAVEEAMLWLSHRLEAADHGAVPSSLLLEEAERDGINTKTLRRAKSRLGVIATRMPFGWSWALPEAGTKKGRVIGVG